MLCIISWSLTTVRDTRIIHCSLSPSIYIEQMAPRILGVIYMIPRMLPTDYV